MTRKELGRHGNEAKGSLERRRGRNREKREEGATKRGTTKERENVVGTAGAAEAA